MEQKRDIEREKERGIENEMDSERKKNTHIFGREASTDHPLGEGLVSCRNI